MDIINHFIGNLISLFAFPGDVTLTFATVIQDIVWQLPNGGTMPEAWHESAMHLGDALNKVNFILPVPEMLGCVAFVFTLKLGIWSFHLVLYVINFIRGVPTAPLDDRQFFGRV